jgi:hypothetical protein
VWVKDFFLVVVVRVKSFFFDVVVWVKSFFCDCCVVVLFFYIFSVVPFLRIVSELLGDDNFSFSGNTSRHFSAIWLGRLPM